MHFNDTIAAISSGSGDSAVGMVRLSGRDAFKIADSVFVSKSGKKISEKEGYTALYGNVFDKNGIFDSAVALIFRNPKSYTGEDVVEITVHGGIFLTRKLLRMVLENGARPAEAGEFTKRAYLNNKMSLSEAEATSSLISAQGESEARAALFAGEGRLARECEAIKSDIVTLIGQIAAYCDYPDEDIVDVSRETLETEISKIQKKLSDMLCNFDNGKMLSNGVDTVIVGGTNVGKSTIMNLLSGYDKSIVTDIAGTTRDIVEDTVRVGEFKLRLSDTAGIRETEDTVEAVGVMRAKKRIESAALIICVFDASRELTDNDLELIESLNGRNTLAVINKQDLKGKIDEKKIEKQFENVVKISARSQSGAESLKEAIIGSLEKYRLPEDAVMLINERQYSCALRAKNEIDSTISALKEGQLPDMLGINLEAAANYLAEISGENINDAVVNEIFAKFCVGK